MQQKLPYNTLHSGDARSIIISLVRGVVLCMHRKAVAVNMYLVQQLVASTVAVSALLLAEAHPHGSNDDVENCAEQEYPTNIRVLMDSWGH